MEIILLKRKVAVGGDSELLEKMYLYCLHKFFILFPRFRDYLYIYPWSNGSLGN